MVSDGNATITVGGSGTSYFTEISVVPNVTYSPTITVGNNKQYQTINAALDAVTNMVRPNNERVTIEIDPGNYEEMLVITQSNVTLKNSSSSPNTNLLNKGVNIDPNAVRITSYYGHGYNYYSMANNQKWNQNIKCQFAKR
jgi:exo-poly-alpha-galacturonosidase